MICDRTSILTWSDRYLCLQQINKALNDVNHWSLIYLRCKTPRCLHHHPSHHNLHKLHPTSYRSTSADCGGPSQWTLWQRKPLEDHSDEGSLSTEGKHLLWKPWELSCSTLVLQWVQAVMQCNFTADFRVLGSCCVLVLNADICCWTFATQISKLLQN